jgi:hypothetical protein
MLKSALISAIALGLAQPALAVTDEEFKTLQDQFNQLADQVESNSNSSSSNRTTVGGYGELHYNNTSNGESGSAREENREIDLHRFVLFVNHEFNDDIRFFSEFEIEHAIAGDSQVGEVEVEQAYVQFDLNDSTQVNAGVFLIPVGILNETHEPPTFYGVERNPVEKNILPATWWEGGAMLSGNFSSGVSYDVAVHSGLNVESDPTKSKFANIRNGRQKTGEAAARSLAATARVKYTGIAGLVVSGTVQFQDDITQDSTDDVNGATLIELHSRYNISNITLTALYATWDIDGAGASAANKDTQDGGYLEASYKLSPKVGVFVRQNEWDNGGTGDTDKSQTDVGVNYWPHENVVVKLDYQAQNDAAGNQDGFNLGLGYQF